MFMNLVSLLSVLWSPPPSQLAGNDTREMTKYQSLPVAKIFRTGLHGGQMCIYIYVYIYAWTIKEPNLPYKTGLDVTQSHPCTVQDVFQPIPGSFSFEGCHCDDSPKAAQSIQNNWAHQMPSETPADGQVTWSSETKWSIISNSQRSSCMANILHF